MPIKFKEDKKEHKPRTKKGVIETLPTTKTNSHPDPITTTIKEQIVIWMKSLDPNLASNNEVKRFRQKDGYFRESHVRGFIDLINIFFENYEKIINDLIKKGLILNEFIEKGLM